MLDRVSVLAPLRGEPARQTILTDPAVVIPVALRREHVLRSQLGPEQMAALQAAGVLVRRNQIAREVRFRVELAPFPVALDSHRTGRVWVQRGRPCHPRLRAGSARAAHLRGRPDPRAEDPVRKVLAPWWFQRSLLGAMLAFTDGDPPAAM